MGHVLAIVSKKVFEKDAADLELGRVWDTDRYVSKSKALEHLSEGGHLFLVTVRPPETVWLVGVLRSPTHDGEAWVAKANSVAAVVVDEVLPDLKLTNGKGIRPKKGKVAMSLQTPRALTSEDAERLLAFAGAEGTAETQVREVLEQSEHPSDWRPEEPMELSLERVRRPSEATALSEVEAAQLAALFYPTSLDEALQEHDLEIAELVREGELAYRLYAWSYGVGYLLEAEEPIVVAMGTQHGIEIWDPSQRPIFYAVDRALREANPSIEQPLSFGWWEDEEWDDVSDQTHRRQRIERGRLVATAESDEALLAELSALEAATERRAGDRQKKAVEQLAQAYFGGSASRRRRPATLGPTERRVLTLCARAGAQQLESLGFPSKDLDRYLGFAEPGPCDAIAQVDGEEAPLWCWLSDTAGGHVSVGTFLAAFASLDPQTQSAAWEELAGPSFPYALWAPVVAEGRVSTTSERGQAYGVRYAQALAAGARQLGAAGADAIWRRADALLSDRRPSTASQQVVALAIIERGEGGSLDPRLDALVESAVGARDRNDALVDRLLGKLEPEHAGRLALARGIWRIREVGKRKKAITIHFDEAGLAFITRFVSAAGTEHLLEGLERHSELKTSGELARARADWPLPMDAIEGYLEAARGLATERIAESIAKGHLHAKLLQSYVDRS